MSNSKKPRCLPEKTMIHTNTGLIPIENIKVGDMVLNSHGGYETINDVFHSGKHNVVKIITEDGEFRCTPNHSIAVISDEKGFLWKKAADIKKGDLMMTTRTPIRGRTTFMPRYSESNFLILDADMAWFLGLYSNIINQEAVKKVEGSMVFIVDIYAVALKVKTQLKKIDSEIPITITKTEKNKFIIICDYCENLENYLDKHLHSQDIPYFIRTSHLDIRMAYIAGVIDTNIYAHSIAANENLKEWLQNIQSLCYSCGFETRLSKYHKKNELFYQLTAFTDYSREKLMTIQQLYNKNITQTHYCLWQKWFPQSPKETDTYYPVKALYIEGEKDTCNTYDIGVEIRNEFYANGYLTHNS